MRRTDPLNILSPTSNASFTRQPRRGGEPLPQHDVVAGPRGRKIALLLWITMLVMILRMTVFIRRTDAASYTSVDAYAMVQIAILAVLAALLLQSGRLPHVLVTLVPTSYVLLLAYYGFGLTSAIWSPQPAYSAYRACEVIIQLLAVSVAVASAPDFRSAEKQVMIVTLLTLICGCVFTIRVFGLTLSREAWHSNGMPASAGILFCYCCGELLAGRTDRARLIRWAAVSGLFVFIGTSSASMISCAFGFLAAAVMTRNAKVIVGSLAAVGVVLVLGGSEAIQFFFFPGKSDAAIAGMNGRLYLWTEFWEEIKSAPYVGHGFAMLARLGTIYATNCHNSVLSVLGGTGFVGGAVFAAWLVKRTVESCADFRSMPAGSVGCAAAFAAGILNSMGIAFLGEGWAPTTLAFACFLALHAVFVRPRSQACVR